MTKIDLNNLDKSTWQTFTFEEIASKVSETVDPNKTELEIYIGLEHIDAEDIHIRRKGTPDDVNGQKLKCYPGDVIFGKRRAYQRKAAIVDFEGICSAHAFILRANPEVIDPKLFPFFIHSDQFMHKMVDISVGGLSPTINWGDLKYQEFQLPPKDQQSQLAELFWSLDEVIEREKNLLEKTDNYLSNYFEDFILKNKSNNVKLGSIMTKSKDEKAIEINRNNILSVRLHLNGVVKNETVDGLKIGATNYFIRKSGQFIYGKQNLFNGALGIVPEELDGFLSSTDIPTLNINLKKLNPKYLLLYIGRKKYYSQLEKLASGSGSKRISEVNFLNIEIALPKIDIQNELILKINKIEKNQNNVKAKLQSSQSLQKSLINQVF